MGVMVGERVKSPARLNTPRVQTRAPRVSVVLPARNEAQNLPHVLPLIPASVYEVILVDGHSTDDTVAVARSLLPTIRVIAQESRGKGDALRRGFAVATGDVIVTLDADGSTDPREIPRFVEALVMGSDYVKGSRYLTGGGSADITRFRSGGNRLLNLFVNLLFGTKFTDLCYGYNAFWRYCLACFPVDCDGFEVEALLNIRAHLARLNIAEAPSYEHKRIHGSSNLYAVRDGFQVLRTILVERLRGRRNITQAGELEPGVEETSFLALETDTDLEATSRVTEADISVVICAYTEKRWDTLIEAVQSVRQQTLRPREIIIVIDHNPALYAQARSTFSDARVVENIMEQGISGARNTGVLIAAGTHVAFLDDDAHAHPEWLAWLAHACRNATVLGSGGRLLPEWPSEQPAWFPEEFGWVVGCSYRGLPTTRHPVRNLIAASVCMRRDVMISAGLFRTDIGRLETIPVGDEDTEFCIRAKRLLPDGEFVYEPRALANHHVTPERATWRYYLRRCYAEGVSKAAIARFVGANRALASERTYTFSTLPRAFARELFAGISRLRGDRVLRAIAIVLGLTATILGYLLGSASALKQLDRMPQAVAENLPDGLVSGPGQMPTEPQQAVPVNRLRARN